MVRKYLNSKCLEKGFTLIEVLTVSGIIITLSAIVLSILFASFRATSKSESLISLRYGGNAVLAQISKKIRYAKSLEDPASCVVPVTTDSITIIADDDRSIIYSCLDSPSTIASNSVNLVDPRVFSISECSFTCSQPSVDSSPTIKINFLLSENISTSSAGEAESLPFQTSITFRNFLR